MKPRRLRRFVAPFYVTFGRKLIRVINQLTNRHSANQYFVTFYKFLSSIKYKCYKVLVCMPIEFLVMILHDAKGLEYDR